MIHSRERRHLLRGRRVACRCLPHGAVNDVARLGDSFGGEAAKATRRAGYQNNCFHGISPPMSPISCSEMPGAEARSDDPAIVAQHLAVDPTSVGPRNETAAAMSEGSPSGSSGASFVRWSITSYGLPSRNSFVAVGPGATALTVMLRPRSSLASTCIMASTAAFVAA
jgi:hypothetical protein